MLFIMGHCAPSEFWELRNSDSFNSVCVNNKQAWFGGCLYKLAHRSSGTPKTPAYPLEAKTVSFMFWLFFLQWFLQKQHNTPPLFPQAAVNGGSRNKRKQRMKPLCSGDKKKLLEKLFLAWWDSGRENLVKKELLLTLSITPPLNQFPVVGC